MVSLIDSNNLLTSANGFVNYGSTNRTSTPAARRQIGVFSAMFIIFNRIIGTGVFATPSMILGLSGSVGFSLVMWVLGAVIAAAGMQVYIIWGTALPHNGGEKNYLEFLFPRPKRLITSMYAANAVLMAYAAGNTLVFAEYFLLSISPPPSAPAPIMTTFTSYVQFTAFLCITLVLLLHGLHLKWGLRIQNLLGVLKIGVLLAVVATGFAALGGKLQPDVEQPRNFESWEGIWRGSKFGGSEICLGLYNVIWSYVGFSNANYALSEVHNPSRTLRVAGPMAIALVTVLYLLANISYLAGVSQAEITGSGRLVAALLFRNVWGERAERVLAAGVAMSALGNVLSVSFSQGRVNQELGKEGILPFSKFWASSWPRNAPLTGLGLHWAVCLIVILCLPAGDAYNFVINVVSYPLAIINAAISFGLIYLTFRPSATTSHMFKRTLSLVLPSLFFGSANVFLFLAPLAKPPPGAEPYEHLPYWTHALAGWAVFGLGVGWWWFREPIEEKVGGVRL
ncbi:high affinity methionine permease [Crucibulum laeve]|uniref:High affinity methionine permease n=1 Tax=Crucibulum laeve TaxID=68775 RepID=A0A5C3LZN7_9AGAR|nr:high affinity methionine permease [Crucibulum laeve]